MDKAGALARLRNMVAADQRPALSTEDLSALLDGARVVDSLRRRVGETGYVDTWNLNAAAAEGWRWKAGKVAGDFDFSADDASYSKAAVMDKCLAMERVYAGRDSGTLQVTTEGDLAPYDSPRLIL